MSVSVLVCICVPVCVSVCACMYLCSCVCVLGILSVQNAVKAFWVLTVMTWGPFDSWLSCVLSSPSSLCMVIVPVGTKDCCLCSVLFLKTSLLMEALLMLSSHYNSLSKLLFYKWASGWFGDVWSAGLELCRCLLSGAALLVMETTGKCVFLKYWQGRAVWPTGHLSFRL